MTIRTARVSPNQGLETNSPSEPLWTAREVAAYLKCSRSWVYLHGEDGTLPSVKIAGLRRFVPSEIRAFALGVPSNGPRKAA